MPQPRYNPKTRKDEVYYLIKESFRDLTDRVRSRVMLNVGVIEEEHGAEDIRDIGKCLTWLSSHKGNITTCQAKRSVKLAFPVVFFCRSK